jgi:hypothetical protein
MEKDRQFETGNLSYENWAQQYAMISPKDRKHPIESLMDICCQRTLYDVRLDLWAIMKAAMYSQDLEDDSSEEKGNMIFHFQAMHDLFEVAYRIRQMVEDKKLLYSYSE